MASFPSPRFGRALFRVEFRLFTLDNTIRHTELCGTSSPTGHSERGVGGSAPRKSSRTRKPAASAVMKQMKNDRYVYKRGLFGHVTMANEDSFSKTHL